MLQREREPGVSVSKDRLVNDLTELGKIGSSPGGGRTRLVLSPEDFEARKFLVTRMERAGLAVRIDQVGNIIGRRGGRDNSLPVVAFGSHIDTVPNAGMLDGCYGVMTALEVVQTLNDNRIVTKHPLEVISFSNEEGVRFPIMTGSKVATGVMDLDTAYQQKDTAGITYLEALQSGGLSIQSLAQARRKPGEIKFWVELHIEQGPVLESEGVKIGVVEAIVGLVHLLVTIQGTAGHAGTTPMNVRRDPMLAAAQIILEVNRVAKEVSQRSVGTVGLLKVHPGAMNVIPGMVELGIDFRDIMAERIEQGIEKVKNVIETICKKSNVEYSLTERARLTPMPMSKDIMESIKRAAEKLAVSYKVMPSGAGHDTQNMAGICQTGMIFVPSRNGISHAPDEWTDPDDLATGANVLLETVMSLSGV